MMPAVVTIRAVRDDDRPMLEAWWRGHGIDPLPLPALPPNGFVAESGGAPVAAAWLYCTDSCIAWLEWFVRDPNASREQMDGVIETLIDEASERARKLGFDLIFCAARHDSLLRKLVATGFVEWENKSMSLLLRKLR